MNLKQSISPNAILAVIAIGAVILVGIAVYAYRSPSATAASSEKPSANVQTAGPPSTRVPMSAAALKGNEEGHGPAGMTEDQKKQIQDWKRNHPGGFTQH
jgi:hypothetical protein